METVVSSKLVWALVTPLIGSILVMLLTVEEFLNDRFHDGDTVRLELADGKILFTKAEKEHADR